MSLGQNGSMPRRPSILACSRCSLPMHCGYRVISELSFQTLKAQTLTLGGHGDDDAIVTVVVHVCSLSARTISLKRENSCQCIPGKEIASSHLLSSSRCIHRI